MEANTLCFLCMMAVCTHVALTAVDSWVMTKQGFPQVSAKLETPDWTTLVNNIASMFEHVPEFGLICLCLIFLAALAGGELMV